MVTVGTGSVGTRFIDKDWPNEVSLSGAGFYKEPDDPVLEET